MNQTLAMDRLEKFNDEYVFTNKKKINLDKIKKMSLRFKPKDFGYYPHTMKGKIYIFFKLSVFPFFKVITKDSELCYKITDKKKCYDFPPELEKLWENINERNNITSYKKSKPTNTAITESLKLLGLEFPFTEETLKRKRNEIMKYAHPDEGGKEDYAKKVNEAYQILRRFADE